MSEDLRALANAVKFLLDEYDSAIESGEVWDGVDSDDNEEVRAEIANHVKTCNKIIEG